MSAPCLRLSFAAFVISAGSALPLDAQSGPSIGNVWTVDDSGGADFSDLQPAVDAASSGDVLLVAAGVYGNVAVLGKGLTILGDGAVPSVRQLVARDLPAGEELVLRSLAFVGLSFTPLTLEENEGTVWVEDCTFQRNLVSNGGIRVKDCSSVVLVRTIVPKALTFFGDALVAEESEVLAFESTFQGAEISATFPFPGGNGATLRSSFLYSAGCLFKGARGNDAECVPSCSPGTAGGTGLDATNAAAVPVALASTFQAGRGGRQAICAGTLCPGAPDGSPTSGTVSTLPAPLRGYELSTPVRSGTSYELTARCQPGELVFSVLSSDLEPLYLPSLSGPRVAAFPVSLVFEGVADATGSLTKTVPVAPLGPSFAFTRLWAQGLFFDACDQPYLGSPSVLVIVN